MSEKARLFKIRLALYTSVIKVWGAAFLLYGLYILIALKLWGCSCPMQLLCGLPCPGCGMMAAFSSLCRGHIAQSLQCHALLLPWLALMILSFYVFFFAPEKLKVIKTGWFLLLWITMLYYFWRMLFCFPSASFSYFRNNFYTFLLQFVKTAS